MRSETISNLVGDLSVLGVYPSNGGGYPAPAGKPNSVLVTNASSIAGWATLLPSGIQSATPINNNDVANKLYVDLVAAGLTPATSVIAATTANLASYVYNNGASGVGATLTAPANGVFTIDGVSPAVGSRVLIKDQTSGAQNGIYTVTVSSAGSLAVLTRATTYDTPAEMNNTGIIPVATGTSNGNTGWLLTAIVVTIGTTTLTYVKFGSTGTVTNIATGAGLTGGPITTTGTIAMANMASSSVTVGTVKGNISGASAAPTDIVLTSASTPSTVMYRDAGSNFSANVATLASANLTGQMSSGSLNVSGVSSLANFGVGRYVEIAGVTNSVYIDFHSNDAGTAVDFDTRIISAGGTNGTGGQGALSYIAATHSFSGQVYSRSALNVGQTGVSSGIINFLGQTSGVVSFLTPSSFTSYNFNLPTTAGNAGQILISQGGGSNAMVWTDSASSADNLSGGVLGSIPYQSSPNTTSLLAPNTTTSLQVLTQTGTGTVGSVPAWLTATSLSTASTIVIRDSAGASQLTSLTLPSTLGQKISLYGGNYGFGIQGNQLQIYSLNSGSYTSIGYGSSSSFTERYRFTDTYLRINGVTSGVVSIGVQASSGTYNYNLPITSGSAGDIQLSGGGLSAPMTWLTPASGISSFLSGGVLSGSNGGTGINNGLNTIKIAGNLTTIGAFDTSFTMTATTTVTFPPSGTLATTTGSISNLSGGILGSIAYQSAPNTTAFLSPNTSTAAQVLTQTGTGSAGSLPVWVTATAASAPSTFMTRDTSSNFSANTATLNQLNVSGISSLANFNVGRYVEVSGATNTVFIDFHSNDSGSAIDYDSRISSAGGTGVAGNGALTYAAATHSFLGAIGSNSTLSFSGVAGPKISLFGTTSTADYGFGVQNNQLQIYSQSSARYTSIGYGSSATFTERYRFADTGFNIYGTTSGVVSIGVRPASGTYNYNLPITSGSSGDISLSGGGGSSPMTWLTPASGISSFLTSGMLPVANTAIDNNTIIPNSPVESSLSSVTTSFNAATFEFQFSIGSDQYLVITYNASNAAQIFKFISNAWVSIQTITTNLFQPVGATTFLDSGTTYLVVANNQNGTNVLSLFSWDGSSFSFLNTVSTGTGTRPNFVVSFISGGSQYLAVSNQIANTVSLFLFSSGTFSQVGSQLAVGLSTTISLTTFTMNGVIYFAACGLSGSTNVQLMSFNGTNIVLSGSIITSGGTGAVMASYFTYANNSYIAVSNSTSNNVSIMMWNGSTFVLSQILTVGTTPYFSSCINVAGFPYIFIPNRGGSTVSVISYSLSSNSFVIYRTINTGVNNLQCTSCYSISNTNYVSICSASVATLSTYNLVNSSFGINPNYLPVLSPGSSNITGGVLGSVPYQSAPSTTSFVSPNITTDLQVLTQTGTGSVSALPSWITATNLATASTIVSRDSSGNISANATTSAFYNLSGSTFAYPLDLRNSSTSQPVIHISTANTDTGLYMSGNNLGSNIAHNMANNGTSWVAKGSSAVYTQMDSQGFRIYANNGLTVGNTFSPTFLYGFSISGVCQFGSVLTTTSTTASNAGTIRLSVTDTIAFRNNANNGNLSLSIDSLDNINYPKAVLVPNNLVVTTGGSGSPLVLTAAQSKTFLTNEGAGALAYINLPATAAGLTFTATVMSANGIRIVAPAGSTLRNGTAVSASGGYAQSTTLGSSITFVAVNSTTWAVTALVGTWALT